jgi:predicted phage baseplate assembly protein
MPLPLPRLDNRSFAELVAEGRRLIPRLARDWTDHNAHDPGITLMELFAWLVEMDIFRLEYTSEASYRAFLRLVGVAPEPAQVAETVLAFGLKPPAPAMTLPAGIQVGDASGKTIFQTTRDLNISQAQIVSVVAARGKEAIDCTSGNRVPGATYYPFTSSPEPESAFYIGLDRPLADVSVEASLYVWTPSIADDRSTREQLITEWETAQSCTADLPHWSQHYSVKTVWEYRNESGEWTPLENANDETRGLTLSGAVVFTAPINHAPGGPDATLYFIRCRLISGQYECPPEIDMVALNTVTARNVVDIDAEEILGKSNGRAGQIFQLKHTPVVAGSTKLDVVLNGVQKGEWREAQFFDRIGPHDYAYVLSVERGEISFGDGRVGRVPVTEAEIKVSYQMGGGAAGNVEASTLSELLDSSHNAAIVQDWNSLRAGLIVEQYFTALGGAQSEELSKAQGRAIRVLSEPQRAVSLADFEALALAVPGVPIARVRALVDYHPDLPCFTATGNITLVVVPRCSAEPGKDFLRAVARYIERRRTLTAEVHVIGPTYTPVIVTARLFVEPHADAKHIGLLAQETLDNFFHPLHGGPDGKGWPVGRDVYRAEVMALLNTISDVIYVDSLGLETEGDTEPRCGNLPVCPNNLLASGQHRIQVIKRSNTR